MFTWKSFSWCAAGTTFASSNRRGIQISCGNCNVCESGKVWFAVRYKDPGVKSERANLQSLVWAWSFGWLHEVQRMLCAENQKGPRWVQRLKKQWETSKRVMKQTALKLFQIRIAPEDQLRQLCMWWMVWWFGQLLGLKNVFHWAARKQNGMLPHQVHVMMMVFSSPLLNGIIKPFVLHTDNSAVRMLSKKLGAGRLRPIRGRLLWLQEKPNGGGEDQLQHCRCQR